MSRRLRPPGKAAGSPQQSPPAPHGRAEKAEARVKELEAGFELYESALEECCEKAEARVKALEALCAEVNSKARALGPDEGYAVPLYLIERCEAAGRGEAIGGPSARRAIEQPGGEP